MQTFITSHNMKQNAKNLDRARLGKQRVEAIQILRTLLGLSNGWCSHPIVKMWRGYEPYLLHVYLKEILDEWESRGYRNSKCAEHFEFLSSLIDDNNNGDEIEKPNWIDDNLILSHRSNLVRKNREYYQELFPNVPDDLPYIWTK